MTYFIAIIHILTACFIVLFILMQDSKGGGFGLGGGTSNTLFGTSGASNFLVKTTRWLALVFAVTSLMLASFSGLEKESLLDEYEPKTETTFPSPQELPELDQNSTQGKEESQKATGKGQE